MITIDGKTFELGDFEKSATAKKKGINNAIKGNDVLDYEHLMAMIVKIQQRFGKPIYINSGIRTKELNNAIGGAKKSQHLSLGDDAAADITAGCQRLNKELLDLIKHIVKNGEIVPDQIIDEKNYTWIHISAKRIGINRKQFLRL